MSGDPSERFGERLDCGCELAQGTWFYCAEHQVRPLDLRAVEKRAGQFLESDDFPVAAFKDLAALLAHCRALRAALQGALAAGDEATNVRSDITTHDYGGTGYGDGVHRKDCRWCRAAAVLAQATDQ